MGNALRVAVTGANGFLGAAVIRALADAGHTPIAVVHRGRNRVPSGVEIRTADLLEPESVSEAFAGAGAVCHLAGLTAVRESWGAQADFFKVNVGGTGAVLGAMLHRDIDRIVFASTATVYNPSDKPLTEDSSIASTPNPMAASKYAAEGIVAGQAKTDGLHATVLRLFNVAGGNDLTTSRIVPQILRAAAGESEAVQIVGGGEAVRDLVHVDDCATAFVAALTRPTKAGECRHYNIGSGTGVSIAAMISGAERVLGRPVPVAQLPAIDEPTTIVADPTRAARELDWHPKLSTLDDIIRDAWDATYGHQAS